MVHNINTIINTVTVTTRMTTSTTLMKNKCFNNPCIASHINMYNNLEWLNNTYDNRYKTLKCLNNTCNSRYKTPKRYNNNNMCACCNNVNNNNMCVDGNASDSSDREITFINNFDQEEKLK